MLKVRSGVIPQQHHGNATNTESERLLASEEEARTFFEVVKQRLLNINSWQYLSGPATAEFKLTDCSGRLVNRLPQTGDHFRIDVPGPGPKTGEGYDWVRVELVDEEHIGDSDYQLVRVRPATNPTNDNKDVAHFFDDEATSNFIVKREGRKVIAGVYGRNEKANTGAEAAVDKLRNKAIATGAISGFAKIQWKSLVNGLVKK